MWLYRDMELPLPPFVGLSICDGDFDMSVTRLNYDARSRRIECWDKPDKEIYEAQLHRRGHRPLDEIVAEYVSAGWHREAR